mmetsp:Transcript_16112/g.54024  ORF Transcript_16112/g.54024 Transcript_16112/m.54024 type:complete len:262 (-) Transcript_16112:509-1294(-)
MSGSEERLSRLLATSNVGMPSPQALHLHLTLHLGLGDAGKVRLGLVEDAGGGHKDGSEDESAGNLRGSSSEEAAEGDEALEPRGEDAAEVVAGGIEELEDQRHGHVGESNACDRHERLPRVTLEEVERMLLAPHQDGVGAAEDEESAVSDEAVEGASHRLDQDALILRLGGSFKVNSLRCRAASSKHSRDEPRVEEESEGIDPSLHVVDVWHEEAKPDSQQHQAHLLLPRQPVPQHHLRQHCRSHDANRFPRNLIKERTEV